MVDAELDALVSAFKAKGIARVSYKRAMSCVSLICNVQKTSQILERVRFCMPTWHLMQGLASAAYSYAQHTLL